MKWYPIILLVVVMAFAPLHGYGVEFDPARQQHSEQKKADPEKDVDGPIDWSRIYGGFAYGDFNAADNRDQLRSEGRSDGYSLMLGCFVKSYLSLETEFLWFVRDGERQSETVISGTADNDVRIISMAFSVNAITSYKVRQFRPYLGFGVGYYDTELLVSDEKSGKFTDKNAPSSENSIGYQLLAGISVEVYKGCQIGVDLRRTFLKGDFGEYSNGEIDLGGDWVMVSLRGGF